MHYDPFTSIYNEINRLKALEKQINRRNAVAAEKVKQQILAALSVEDVVELVYRKCPSYGELSAFITLLRSASSLDDIRVAKSRSEVFKNITDSNFVNGAQLTARLKAVIEDFDEIFKLAVHENSEDGPDISPREYEILNDILLVIGFLVSDHATMLDSKYRNSQRRKALH